jgi:hypothetical protein
MCQRPAYVIATRGQTPNKTKSSQSESVTTTGPWATQTHITGGKTSQTSSKQKLQNHPTPSAPPAHRRQSSPYPSTMPTNAKIDSENRINISTLDMSPLVVYYESIKREPKIRGIYECRCDERLQSKTKEFTRLPYTTIYLLERIKAIKGGRKTKKFLKGGRKTKTFSLFLKKRKRIAREHRFASFILPRELTRTSKGYTERTCLRGFRLGCLACMGSLARYHVA